MTRGADARPSRRTTAALLVAAGTALAVVSACEDLPPLPAGPEGGFAARDPVREAGPPVEAGPSPSDAGTDAPVAPLPCTDATADEQAGVFVQVGGSLGACGARSTPCATITRGITRAQELSKGSVYVAQGTYDESLSLVAGVRVEGGWDETTTPWVRTCAAPGITTVRAEAGETTVVLARDLGGAATLAFVRLESATSTPPAGASLYGIRALGASTTLTLEEVRIDVGNASAGAPGAAGSAGTTGTSACVTSGTGAPGAPGAAGVSGAGFSFDPEGIVSADGTSGASGSAGKSGTAGGAGTCVSCGTCDLLTCIFTPAGGQTCGTAGKPGCGGGGGGPGAGGKAGGSSVGLYAWDATVTVRGGRIRSGNGGAGGAGGGAGGAGAGGAAQAGTGAGTCAVGCAGAPGACAEVLGTAQGGSAGGLGGAGGAGGAGGGGVGGSSVAVYQGGAGVVSLTSVTLANGTAGAGGGPGSAPSGIAASKIP